MSGAATKHDPALVSTNNAERHASRRHRTGARFYGTTLLFASVEVRSAMRAIPLAP